MYRTSRIEVAPVPPISNNTTAIPAVILIVILFLSIFDTDSVTQKVEYKIYHIEFYSNIQGIIIPIAVLKVESIVEMLLSCI